MREKKRNAYACTGAINKKKERVQFYVQFAYYY